MPILHTIYLVIKIRQLSEIYKSFKFILTPHLTPIPTVSLLPHPLPPQPPSLLFLSSSSLYKFVCLNVKN